MIASRTRAWLIALAIFVLGLAVGTAATAALGLRSIRQALRDPEGRVTFAERATDRIERELTRSLDLTPAEAKQLAANLEQTRANFRALRQRAAVDIRGELRATVRRIAADLPPEKRREFLRHVARRVERLGLPALEETDPHADQPAEPAAP